MRNLLISIAFHAVLLGAIGAWLCSHDADESRECVIPIEIAFERQLASEPEPAQSQPDKPQAVKPPEVKKEPEIQPPPDVEREPEIQPPPSVEKEPVLQPPPNVEREPEIQPPPEKTQLQETQPAEPSDHPDAEPTTTAPVSSAALDQPQDIEPVATVKPKYPRSAKRHGIEGDVTVNLEVAPAGDVLNASVIASSGNSALDRAALEAAWNAKFRPGTGNRRCLLPFAFRLK